MGIDLITVLSVMGTVGVGNPLSLNPGFSIGGKSQKANNILGNLFGLLGTPRGLDGAHNWIESDSSNTRDDLYVTGDAATMNMTLFLGAYNSQTALSSPWTTLVRVQRSDLGKASRATPTSTMVRILA